MTSLHICVNLEDHSFNVGQLTFAFWHLQINIFDSKDGSVVAYDLSFEVFLIVDFECVLRAFWLYLAGWAYGIVGMATMFAIERTEEDFAKIWDVEEEEPRSTL